MDLTEQVKKIEQLRKVTTHTTTSDICPKCRGTGYMLVGFNGQPTMAECDCGMLQKQRMSNANIPQRYANATFNDFDVNYFSGADKDIAIKDLKIAQYFIEHFDDNKGMYIFSKTKGTGKTLISVIIANEMSKRGIGCKFTTSGQILDDIKKSWDRDNMETEDNIVRKLQDVSLLIIDDFGVDGSTDWRNEKYYQIINDRYIHEKPTIFTSNYSLNDLQRIGYDSRIVNRIEESCYVLPFPNTSIRTIKAQVNKNQISSRLGDN